jgi:hypothetical protein
MSVLRKPRVISDDPEFPYQVGRLLGAAEGAALRLRATGDPVDRLASEHLISIVAWFVSKQESAPPAMFYTDETPTGILAPPSKEAPVAKSFVDSN